MANKIFLKITVQFTQSHKAKTKLKLSLQTLR